jgi:hypothetical protein
VDHAKIILCCLHMGRTDNVRLKNVFAAYEERGREEGEKRDREGSGRRRERERERGKR